MAVRSRDQIRVSECVVNCGQLRRGVFWLVPIERRGGASTMWPYPQYHMEPPYSAPAEFRYIVVPLGDHVHAVSGGVCGSSLSGGCEVFR